MNEVMEEVQLELKHFIGGEMIDGKSGLYGQVYNPSTGEVIGKCPLALVEEVDEAVFFAKKAFLNWRDISVSKRVKVIEKFKILLLENIEELAKCISRENGKTIADAKGGILRGVESVDLALNAPNLLKGEYSDNVGGEINAYSIKKPLGVVAAIAPFNFPVMVPVAMTTMAIAVGNAVILKPSEKVPNSALFLAKLWKESGLPNGIFSVVNGDKIAVDQLLEHPDIEAISFVGSTKIAEYVYQKGTSNNKRVAAFGGGKNHMVIMPDANLDQAVNSFLGAAYGAASQRCMAISTAMPVGKETADRFVSKLKEQIKALKVGPYTDLTADFGALISEQSKQSVVNAINCSIEQGAELVVDGRNLEIANNKGGFYLGPTLLDHVTPEMDIYKEEVFGPARIVTRVNRLEEAIDLINGHEYGNGVTIFTNSGASARKFTNEIEVGMVGVNVPIPIPVGYHNFGGWKRSKFGEGHMFGPDTVRFFTKSKTISERWFDEGISSETNFSFPNSN